MKGLRAKPDVALRVGGAYGGGVRKELSYNEAEALTQVGHCLGRIVFRATPVFTASLS